uniref:cytochrome c oxidase subunit II n=1 Tax=Carassotrema koreanum TaxID=2573094 RepID=UPI0021769D07|nr:cytochrome c oxidase subunit II [Carassotrema koreanum]UUF92005.1 cytochrome c oxidase subunit II [Carassotrema koreanum]
MLLYTPLYVDMLYLVFAVCVFIPVWVVTILVWGIGRDTTQGIVPLENEDDIPEFFWTIAPSWTVLIFCYLNLGCLVFDARFDVSEAIKIVGRQWYWSYETSDSGGQYDSVMGDFLEGVDKPLRVYKSTCYQLLATSSDVIHSFALPDYNLKVDAIPGRLNQTFLALHRVGVFVGYCSELCGAGHAYMPIVIECGMRPKL